MKTILNAGLLALLLAACQQSNTPKQPIPKPTAGHSLGQCAQRICTMQYEPVCASVERNGTISEQTFGNACSACVDDGRIIQTRPGACGTPAAE